MLEREAYLLQNQLNPFPVLGKLVLTDEGRLRFTLGAGAKDASMGWLEKTLGTERLKEPVAAGERPVVFDVPVAGHKVSWPVSLGVLCDEDRGRGAVVDREPRLSLERRALAVDQHLRARGTSKPWKHALAAAA
jgi:hypothetical protein